MARHKTSPPVYFKCLRLTNVKTFEEEQELLLTDQAGRPARWTLILGENGVGKTTLLQCLAFTRPVLTIGIHDKADVPVPDLIRAAVLEGENAELTALARAGASGRVILEANFVHGRPLGSKASMRKSLTTSVDFALSDGYMSGLRTGEEKKPNGFVEPLVVAYGAARHASSSGRTEGAPQADDMTKSLFDPSAPLDDPESILSRLDYANYKASPGSGHLLARVKATLARLLPDVADADAIRIYGPPTPGNKSGKFGVQVVTPYGEVPIKALSLGYQTVMAWIVDLSWKMFQRFPESVDPLAEPAVVLIDEIDLHLHPKWQRQLRGVLTEFFPAIQFIATAHSPLMAQSYLDANLALVRREDDRSYAVIENDPAIVRTWRLDEVITSELFGLETAYPPEVGALLKERGRLLRSGRLSDGEADRLRSVQAQISALPTERDPEDQKALDILRRAAALLTPA